MFKTFYGLAFKNYFINSETYEVYHNKYLSDNFCGWFLIVSIDGGATWEKVNYIQDPKFSDKCWSQSIGKLFQYIERESRL